MVTIPGKVTIPRTINIPRTVTFTTPFCYYTFFAKLSLNSTQTKAEDSFNSTFSSHPATHPKKEFLRKLDLRIFQLQLSLNSTQSQLNSTSTQTTELGTTQLKLVVIINDVDIVFVFSLSFLLSL